MTAFEQMARQLIATKRQKLRVPYLRTLERWILFCSAHNVDPMEPSAEDAQAFLELRSEHQEEGAARVELSALGFIYGELHRAGIGTGNVFGWVLR